MKRLFFLIIIISLINSGCSKPPDAENLLSPAITLTTPATITPATSPIASSNTVVLNRSAVIYAENPTPIFKNLWGIEIDGSGNVIVADPEGNLLRKVTPQQNQPLPLTPITYAGTGNNTHGYLPFTPLTSANITGPTGLTYSLDKSILFIMSSDPYNNIMYALQGSNVTAYMGFTDGGRSNQNGVAGYTPGATPQQIAGFSEATDIKASPDGHLYVADTANNRIFQITMASPWSVNSGSSTTFVGGGPGRTDSGHSNGIGLDALFHKPMGLAISKNPPYTIYVSDSRNNLIRAINPNTKLVTTFAGGGPGEKDPGSTDGTGTDALFNFPVGLALDSNENLYVADAQNNAICVITPQGVVRTLVLDNSQLSAPPLYLAIDSQDNIFVTTFSKKIIKINHP